MMRDAQAVLADCRAGLLSSQAALAVYGVVVYEAELDETATSQVRLRRGAARCDAPLFSFGPARMEYEQLWTDELSASLTSLFTPFRLVFYRSQSASFELLIERDSAPPTASQLRNMWDELASFHLLSDVGAGGKV